MSAPETLADLAADFRALPARDRRAVLAALSPAERAKLETLLGSIASARAAAPGPADRLGTFSLWLAARLREGPQAGAAAPWKMTAAARQLLQQVADDYLDEAPADAGVGRRSGSLVEALAALFLPRQPAR